MEIGRLLTSLIFIVVPIVAIIVYVSISYQFLPKECKMELVGDINSILGNLKICVDNCWSKHNFGKDIYSDDCYVVLINSTKPLDKNRIEKFLGNTKVYFDFLEENVEHRIKIRYNSTGKEISLIRFT